MTKIIDASEGISSITVDYSSKADFCIDVFGGRSLLNTYFPSDILTIEEIGEDSYRSVEGAATWAIAVGLLAATLGLLAFVPIAGALLTGALGFLAGAAIGGRRKYSSIFLVVFNDKKFVAFDERQEGIINKIKALLSKQKVSSRVKALQSEGTLKLNEIDSLPSLPKVKE